MGLPGEILVEEGQKWGAKLGGCLGQEFEATFTEEATGAAGCEFSAGSEAPAEVEGETETGAE